MSINKNIFNVGHDSLMLDDFVVMNQSDLDVYIRNRFHNWQGQHLQLAVYLTPSNVIADVCVIAKDHKASIFKGISLIMSTVYNVHNTNVYMINMYDNADFVNFTNLGNISESCRASFKGGGFIMRDHFLYVGNSVISLSKFRGNAVGPEHQ